MLTGKGRDLPSAVALFDLDGFKEVNDTLGHSTGDKLLNAVGQRLVSATEDGGDIEKVYRLGGDEFVVLMPNCGDPRAIADLVDVAMKGLAQPFHIDDHVLHVGASAGIAIAPNDGACADDLISNADLSLYQAKFAGGRGYRLFVPPFVRRRRHGTDLALNFAALSPTKNLNFTFNLRFDLQITPLWAQRHSFAGAIRCGALLRLEPLLTRSRRAPSLRISADGSFIPRAKRQPHGAIWDCQ